MASSTAGSTEAARAGAVEASTATTTARVTTDSLLISIRFSGGDRA
jgi:hypothetical protein